MTSEARCEVCQKPLPAERAVSCDAECYKLWLEQRRLKRRRRRRERHWGR